jgi:hypothetical protein
MNRNAGNNQIQGIKRPLMAYSLKLKAGQLGYRTPWLPRLCYQTHLFIGVYSPGFDVCQDAIQLVWILQVG